MVMLNKYLIVCLWDVRIYKNDISEQQFYRLLIIVKSKIFDLIRKYYRFQMMMLFLVRGGEFLFFVIELFLKFFWLVKC